MGFKDLFIINKAGNIAKLQDNLIADDYDSYLKVVMDNGASFKIRKMTYTNPDRIKIEYFELVRELPFDKNRPEFVIARTIKKPRDILWFILLEKCDGYVAFNEDEDDEIVIYHLHNGLEYLLHKQYNDEYILYSNEVIEPDGEIMAVESLDEAKEMIESLIDKFYLSDDQLTEKYYGKKPFKYSVKLIGKRTVVRIEGENFWIEEEIDLPLN